MAGHGRLCQRIVEIRCESTARGFCCALLLAGISLAPSHLRAAQHNLVDARFRLEWKSVDARFWKLQIAVAGDPASAASIQEVTNLSSNEKTTGAIELTPDASSVTIRPRHALADGAVQFRLRGARRARISIKVATYRHHEDGSLSHLPATELSLADLVDQGAITSSSDEVSDTAEAATWALTRVEKDTLRIENLPTKPVVEPNSELNFSVRCCSMMDQTSRQLTLRAAVIRIADNVTVSSRQYPITVDARGNSEPVAVSEVVPDVVGVYEIRCQLFQTDDSIWSRLRRSEPPVVGASRAIVVQSSSGGAEPGQSLTWRSVGEIRPSESSWSVGQWIPQSTSRLMPGSASVEPEIDLPSENYSGEVVSLIQPGHTFQAKLPVLSPGTPHRITIRFPARRRMRLRLDLARAGQRDSGAFSFVLNHHPKLDHDADWTTHSFVYYPRAGEQIWLTNLDEASAAFESISVHAGPKRLSSQTTSRGTERQAVLRLAGSDWVDSLTSDIKATQTGASFDPATVAMHRTWIAVNRIADYAVASGMNGLMIPIDEGPRLGKSTASLFPRRQTSSLDDPTSLALSLLERTDLNVMLSLRPTRLLSGPERAIRQTPASASKLTRAYRGNNAQYNLLHPEIQNALAAWIAELDQHYSQFTCFAGMALDCDNPSHLQPLKHPEQDPETLARFAHAKGMPAASAQQHRSWVTQQGKPVFDAWLQQETRKAYLKVARALKVAGAATSKPIMMMMEVTTDGESDDQFLRLVAPAKTPAGGDAGLMPARVLRYGSDQVLAENQWLLKQLSVLGSPSGGVVPVAILDAAPSITSDQPLGIDEDVIADLGRILDQMDPEILVVDHRVLAGQWNEGLTAFFKAFTFFPGSGVKSFPGPDPASQTVHVRSGTQDGSLFVSMISLVPWSAEVELETSTAIDWVVVGHQESSSLVSLQQRGSNRVRVVIPPGRAIMLQSTSPTDDAHLTAWSSRVSGGPETLKQIKRQVTEIVERLGALSEFAPYDVLTNGGFEQSGGMGLVGWLHAQHPPGCVRVDDKQRMEGKQSVLLTTHPSASTRTWIVSETIDPPASGRLAVSLACRGENRSNAPPHRLKVSLEGTRRGQPIRHSKEFEVPRNGQWGTRNVVLEVDGIDSRKVDSLRLTIDSLSGGRVWIDDVRLHDQFATEQERDELQSLAFLAVQGLQRGNLAPSGRLLRNDWARHLLAVETPRKSKPPIDPEQAQRETPSVAERLRSWLPRPLRF